MNWSQQLAAFAPQQAQTALGGVAYLRTATPVASDPGQGPSTLVLLHGIGSASASWLAQLARFEGQIPVLAWDAPGYGQSQPLSPEKPVAKDYAERLWAWLDALHVEAPVTLVGHSLGALMAASAARIAPRRVAQLVLLAPAQGYARAPELVREKRLTERLANLRSLGPRGIAQSRGAAMLSDAATPDMLAFITEVMAGIDPAGYTQATHMLSGGDILADLQALSCPVLVASGSADTITPAKACQAMASAAGASYLSLGPVGHACALEAGDAVNALLARSVGVRE